MFAASSASGSSQYLLARTNMASASLIWKKAIVRNIFEGNNFSLWKGSSIRDHTVPHKLKPQGEKLPLSGLTPLGSPLVIHGLKCIFMHNTNSGVVVTLGV